MKDWCKSYVNRLVNAKKVALVAACYLNPWSRYDSKWPDHYLNFIKFFWDHNIPFMQMRCPEELYMGFDRMPATKDMYNTKEFRRICRNQVEKQILPMVSPLRGQLFYVGVQKSPSCACTITTVGPDIENAKIVSGQGILVEELVKILDEKGKKITLVDLKFKNRDFSALEKALGL